MIDRKEIEKHLEGRMIVCATLWDGMAILYLDDGTDLAFEAEGDVIHWEIRPNGYLEEEESDER